jgi:hypothetical protein
LEGDDREPNLNLFPKPSIKGLAEEHATTRFIGVFDGLTWYYHELDIQDGFWHFTFDDSMIHGLN